jgi:hypothetical protein
VREPVEFVKKGVLGEGLRFLGYVLDAVSCVENVFDSLVGQEIVLAEADIVDFDSARPPKFAPIVEVGRAKSRYFIVHRYGLKLANFRLLPFMYRNISLPVIFVHGLHAVFPGIW